MFSLGDRGGVVATLTVTPVQLKSLCCQNFAIWDAKNDILNSFMCKIKIHDILTIS